MLLQRELRRFPSLHGVARRALGATRPLGELAIVGIRFVAVHARLESQRLLEISAAVALDAIHRRMFPEQGIFRFRVIEALADGCG